MKNNPFEFLQAEEVQQKIKKSSNPEIDFLEKEKEYYLKLKEKIQNLESLYNPNKNSIENQPEKYKLSFTKLENYNIEKLGIKDGLNYLPITKEDLLLTIPWGIYYRLDNTVPDKIREKYFSERINFILTYLKNKQIEIIQKEHLEKYHRKEENPFKNINSFQEKLFNNNYSEAKQGRLAELLFFTILKQWEKNKNNEFKLEVEKTDIFTDVLKGIDFRVKLNELENYIDYTINNNPRRLEHKNKKIIRTQGERNDYFSNYFVYQSNLLTNPLEIISKWEKNDYKHLPTYWLERNFEKEIFLEFFEKFSEYQNISKQDPNKIWKKYLKKI